MKKIKMRNVIVRGIIYIILYVIILSVLWRFLLDESVFDVIFR